MLYLNSKRLDRTWASFVATFVHEWVHSVDALVAEDFHHGDNSPDGKGNSAPYWIDTLAARMVAQFLHEDAGAAIAKTHELLDGDRPAHLERIIETELAALGDTGEEVA